LRGEEVSVEILLPRTWTQIPKYDLKAHFDIAIVNNKKYHAGHNTRFFRSSLISKLEESGLALIAKHWRHPKIWSDCVRVDTFGAFLIPVTRKSPLLPPYGINKAVEPRATLLVHEYATG
jgi:hypothetical protein